MDLTKNLNVYAFTASDDKHPAYMRPQAMLIDLDRFFHLAAKHVYPMGTPARIGRITSINLQLSVASRSNLII